MSVSALVILYALSLAGSTEGNEQCQSLVNVPSCQPWGNCSGLLCPKASFTVSKCEDPVVVRFTVNNYTVQLTQSSDVPLNASHRAKVSIFRDNNNLFINATLNELALIPNAVVPLNATVCMCRSLQQLSTKVQNTVPQLSCSTNAQCDGVQCSATALSGLYGVDMAVLPCRDPPALRISLVDAQGRQTYSGVFDRSQNASVSSLLTLSVAIVQREYSMDVKVTANSPLYGTFPVLPTTTVILDKSNCSLVPTVAPPALSTPTCKALQNLQSGLPTCSLNKACSGLNCAVLGFPYAVSFEVEPCSQPASVLLTVRDSNNGAILYNRSINDTVVVPLGANISISVVVRQLPGAIGLKVDLMVASRTVGIIPFYTIPINQSQCSSDSAGSGAPTTPTPLAPSQCEAFRSLAVSSRCVTNAACDGVFCSFLDYQAAISTVPCNTPPAVTVSISDSNGTVLFSRVVDRTQQVPLVGGAMLLITINQLNEAIGLEVALQTVVSTTSIVPYTVIPLNTTNCGPTQSTPTSSPDGMCAALISATLNQELCSTNMACDEIDCSVQGYTTAVAVLPCNSPPAIRLTVADSNGTTLFSQAVSRSRQVPLLGGTVTLQVIVDQLDGALGVQVGLSTLFGSGTIIPYTVIPINTSSCPRTQAPPTSPPEVATTCDALSSITSYNPSCLTNGACDSLTCTAFGLSTGFTVLPCNSPPAVVVSVRNSNGTSLFSQTLSQSQLVPLFGGALTLVVTVDQLNNSLGLKVDAVSAFGGSINLIPYTAIPLNTSNCGPTGATPSMTPQPTSTCAALTSISAAGQGCSVTPSCNEVDCSLLGYSTGFIVLPCNSPPAIGIIVNDTRNNTLFYQVISQSQQIPLFGLTSLDVTVVQLSNAIGLKVDVSPLPGTRVNVVPYTVIPLNTSNCGTTGAPPTSAPPTSTCGGLNNIAASNQACSPTTDCEGVNCSYLNYTIGVAVVPCSTPPGVKLTVRDSQRTVLYSQTLTQSQNLTIIAGLISLQAKIDQMNGSLGVKIDAISPLGLRTIIPYTIIPLNTSSCTYNSTQAPPPPDTCSALREISAAVKSCSTTAACDGVDCLNANYRLSMRVLPCETPPSVRLSAYEQTTGTVLYDKVASQSQQIPITSFASLNVTLVQLTDAIGFKVDLISVASRTNLVPFTVIPINRAGCNTTSRPGSVTWSVPASPSPAALNITSNGDSQQDLSLIVGVPLGIIFGVLLAAAVTLVGGIALRRHIRKVKSGSYRLMEMTDSVASNDAESD